MQDNGHRTPPGKLPSHSQKQDDALQEGEFIRLEQAIEGGEAPLEDRAEKLRRLKEQVRKGSYKPDLHKVARVLIHDDTDALVGS